MKKMALLLTAVILFATAYSKQVMMQGWYWNYPKTVAGKSWADTLRFQAASLKQANGMNHSMVVGELYGTNAGGLSNWVNNVLNGMTASTKAAILGNVSVPPLELLSFEAKTVNKLVQLQWRVAQNEEVKSMEVERSEDGAGFVKFGGRLATNQSGNADYDFVDATPKKNVSLMYRIRLIGKNGSSLISDIRMVRIDEGQMTVRLRQNPVRSNAEVELSSTIGGKAVLTIVSTAGQKMTAQSVRIVPGTNQVAIPAQGFPQGVYQLVVEMGKERKTISFVKE